MSRENNVKQDAFFRRTLFIVKFKKNYFLIHLYYIKMSTRWITPNFFFVFTQAGLKKLLFRYETKLAYLIKKRTIGLSDTEHGPGARSNARGRERLGRADGAAVGVTFQALVPRNWSTFPRSRKPSRTRLFPVPFLALTRS